MVSFTTAFVAAVAATGALAAPTAATNEAPSKVKRNSPNSTGTSGGYYYQFWDDGTSGTTTYTNGDAGKYSVTWNNVGDFTSGKGWQTAQPRNISFAGSVSVQNNGNFYLAVYTWSMQGENYILENYGGYNPCSASDVQQQVGTIYSDGSNYQVCIVNRGNNYLQNWSVRQNKRSTGVVTTANHYNYYAAHGNHNPLSAAVYQIMSTEGYQSSGSASITVSDAGAGGSGSSSPPASSSSSAASSPSSTSSAASSSPTSGTCSAIYGQCGGQGWNGPTCCQSGSTCKVGNQYYSQCL